VNAERATDFDGNDAARAAAALLASRHLPGYPAELGYRGEPHHWRMSPQVEIALRSLTSGSGARLPLVGSRLYGWPIHVDHRLEDVVLELRPGPVDLPDPSDRDDSVADSVAEPSIDGASLGPK